MVGSLRRAVGLGLDSKDRLADNPMSELNAFQNWYENYGPRSETMSTGSLWIRKTCCTISWAVSLPEGSLGRGMNWAALENQSTTVRMAVMPSDGGNPVTKSRDIWDQGR